MFRNYLRYIGVKFIQELIDNLKFELQAPKLPKFQTHQILRFKFSLLLSE